jgi:hypothetical protein
MAGAHEHAAVLRHQRKDVAGLDDVVGLRVAAHGGTHGPRTIGGGDARRDAFRGLDRRREVRAHRRAVVVTIGRD